jgi:hypothetical protein
LDAAQFLSAHRGGFPIDDGNLRERIRGELLETALQDNVKARFLTASGSWSRQRPRRGAVLHRSQNEFIQTAGGASVRQASARKSKAAFPRFKLAPNPFSAKTR